MYPNAGHMIILLPMFLKMDSFVFLLLFVITEFKLCFFSVHLHFNDVFILHELKEQ